MAEDPTDVPEDKTEGHGSACSFATTESGAVTVDWVVLSAALIGMGMLVLEPVVFSASGTSNKIADDIENFQVGYPGN
jgi:hypothetical protein